PAAADAVHDRAAHDVGGVHVAGDVGFDHAIHGQHPEPAHDLRVVGDLLTAQQDAALVAVNAGQEPAYAIAGQPERRGGRRPQRPGVEQVDHAVLQPLGERDQVDDLAVVESGEDGVVC